MSSDLNIASFLKQLRKTSGLVARDVTEKLAECSISISQKTLYGYESGLSMPNADTFVALCQIYKCDNPMDILGQPKVDVAEMELIKKYRTLDEYGKGAVESVLDWEYRRFAASEAPASVQAELEREAIHAEVDRQMDLKEKEESTVCSASAG